MLYNLWLGFNIVIVMLLPVLWLVGLLALAWAATLVLALLRSSKAQWRKAVPTSGLIGLVGMVLAFALFPSLVGSSFADLDQFADWLFIVGISVGIGVALFLATWPSLSYLKKSA